MSRFSAERMGPVFGNSKFRALQRNRRIPQELENEKFSVNRSFSLLTFRFDSDRWQAETAIWASVWARF